MNSQDNSPSDKRLFYIHMKPTRKIPFSITYYRAEVYELYPDRAVAKLLTGNKSPITMQSKIVKKDLGIIYQTNYTMTKRHASELIEDTKRQLRRRFMDTFTLFEIPT